MKTFAIKILSIGLLILSLLITVNLIVDPAKLFKRNHYNKMINIIDNNTYLTNIMNFDERLLNKMFVEKLSERYDILVMGSSRTKLIRDEYFSNSELFNTSVSGASIEDLIAIYQLYKTHNMLPDSIYIGIDPWIFNVNNNQERWKTLKKEYYSFLNEPSQSNTSQNRLLQLISPSYFQESLILLFKSGFKLAPTSTEKKYNKLNTILNDGSLVYSKEYREVSSEEINKKAIRFVSGDIYSIEDFNQISSTHINLFKKLIYDMQEQNIKIKFLLVPYHPIVFNKISNNNKYKNVLLTEIFIRKFASENSITTTGSLDPKRINFDNSFFYDGMHCNEKGIRKLLE